MFWFLILLIGLIYLVHDYMINKKFNELMKKLPGGEPYLPLLRHAYIFLGSDEDYMNAFKKTGLIAMERGGLASFWLINQCCVVVSDPAASEALLKSCLEKRKPTTFLKFVVGNGSIYAPVSIWRPRRKLLAPAFSMKKLNKFVDVFAEQSAVMVEQLQPSVGKGTISLWKYLTTYTFDSVCETTLGVHMNSQSMPSHPFLEALDKSFKMVVKRVFQPWLHSDWLYRLLPQYKVADKCRKMMYEFIDGVIKSKRKEIVEKQRQPDYIPRKDSHVGYQSLLETLLETSIRDNVLTDLELREETLVMSVAGTDTSAVGTGFALVILSRYPEVQEKVVEELNEVLESSEKAVTAADLPRLKYLEAVVKETLRLYPPVPIINRYVSNDTELQSGVTLPKGTVIMLNIWAIHRNPRYWGADADLFRPERFFEPLTHPAQFVPFSFGLRNCLGSQYAMMSMKTAIATVLRHYRVLPPVGADEKTLKEPLRVKYDIMMKAVDNFQIQLEKRAPQTTRKIG